LILSSKDRKSSFDKVVCLTPYPPTFQQSDGAFYLIVFSHGPNGKVAKIVRMLKAIHAEKDRLAAQN
jgi:hypothetical protein